MRDKDSWHLVVDKRLNYGRENIAAFLQMAAPFRTVVDLGAGSGADLDLAAAASPGAERYAVESYPPNVAVLERRHHVLPLNIEVDPLPFADESIDVVMSNQVLEHVKEIFWILHQTTRVLRVGGTLILGVPNLASFHNRCLLAIGHQPTVIQNHSAHVRGYTRRDVLRLLEHVFPAGYELQAFRGSNFYPLPPVLARPMARLWPNGAWGIFLMFRKIRAYSDEFLFYPVKEKLETNYFVGDARERLAAGETADR